MLTTSTTIQYLVPAESNKSSVILWHVFTHHNVWLKILLPWHLCDEATHIIFTIANRMQLIHTNAGSMFSNCKYMVLSVINNVNTSPYMALWQFSTLQSLLEHVPWSTHDTYKSQIYIHTCTVYQFATYSNS